MFAELRIGPQWVLRPEDIRAIATDYDLGDTVTSVQGLGGAVNGVARIASGRGQFVVRVHRPWTTPERLAGIHQIQEMLRLAEYPLPRVLRNRAGKTWTRLADRLVEVSEFVPSDGSADSWARSETACIMLGCLHTLLSGAAPDGLPAPEYSSYATPATALAMLEETDAPIGRFADQPEYGEVVAAREATRTLLQMLAAERSGYEAALPRCLTHGDFGGDNVLLRDERVVAVLDFDFMDYRERIYDLAYALYWALDRFCQPRGAVPIPDRCLTKAARLVQRYRAHIVPDLTESELAALPFEMARVPLYQIAEAGYTADVAGTAGPLGQTLANARHLPVAQWLAANGSRVQAALSTSSV